MTARQIAFLVVLMTAMTLPLYADPPHADEDKTVPGSTPLSKHEENLERMKVDRGLDNEHARKAQEVFRIDSAHMSEDTKQQSRNVKDLKSMENQVVEGKSQMDAAHQSYKETAQKYGSADPRSTAAQHNLKETQHALNPLLKKRQQLKEDVHHGGRLVHNDKTVLSVQTRAINSDARYRAADDRKIKQEEKNIAEEKNTLAENAHLPEPRAPK